MDCAFHVLFAAPAPPGRDTTTPGPSAPSLGVAGSGPTRRQSHVVLLGQAVRPEPQETPPAKTAVRVVFSPLAAQAKTPSTPRGQALDRDPIRALSINEIKFDLPHRAPPPAPPPPPPPACANAPELNVIAATNESARILTRETPELHVLGLNAIRESVAAPLLFRVTSRTPIRHADRRVDEAAPAGPLGMTSTALPRGDDSPRGRLSPAHRHHRDRRRPICASSARRHSRYRRHEAPLTNGFQEADIPLQVRGRPRFPAARRTRASGAGGAAGASGDPIRPPAFRGWPKCLSENILNPVSRL